MNRAIVSLYFKSGNSLSFRVREFSWSKAGNNLTSASMVSSDLSRPDYYRLDEIEAIVSRPMLWARVAIFLRIIR